MKSLVLLVLLGGSMALGLFLGARVLRRVRNNPVHIAIHLLLGIAGLQLMAMLRRGAPDGTVVAETLLGNAAALALVLALLSGLLAPIVARHGGRRPAAVALIAHASFGASGFLLFLAWLLQAR